MTRWATAEPILATLCAAAYAVIAATIVVASRRSLALLAFVLVSLAWSLWAAWHASMTLNTGSAGELATVRTLSAVAVVLVLHRRVVASLGASTSPGAVRFLAVGVALAAAAVSAPLLQTAGDMVTLSTPSISVRMALDIFGLLLVENAYLNAPLDVRWHVSLPCVALGGLFAYDIALTADAALFRAFSPLLLRGQFILAIIVAPLLGGGSLRDRRDWSRPLSLPREPAFHTATLLLAGAFLVGLAVAGEVFRDLGADWGHVAEISLVFAGVIGLGLVLTTPSIQSQMRRLLIEPFTGRRYDYRREWLRCIDTLSGPRSYVSLPMRAIRAAADVVNSPGGILFLRDDEEKAFRWSGSWNLPTTGVELPADGAFVRQFGAGDRVAVAGGQNMPWLGELPTLWLAVPLSHRGKLSGFICLDRPRAAFALDREVFDLLRVVACEIAGFLAERRAAESLLQSRQMRAFGERFAFVAHDIKNVSGQLTMLLANAEQHIDNPDFQRDMLRTVRASVQKIGTMLVRLREPHASASGTCSPADRAAALAATRFGRIRLRIEGDPLVVSMTAEHFDSVLAHLVDNAIEAGGAAAGLRVRHDGERVIVEVTDDGIGMSAEFVANSLFRPFASSKPTGFGIGAYQAREMVRLAGGDLQAVSSPGRGTTMRIVLPAADGSRAAPQPASSYGLAGTEAH